VEKGESPSGLAANALSARRFKFLFYFAFFQLWRELVRAAQPRACQDKLTPICHFN